MLRSPQILNIYIFDRKFNLVSENAIKFTIVISMVLLKVRPNFQEHESFEVSRWLRIHISFFSRSKPLLSKNNLSSLVVSL